MKKFVLGIIAALASFSIFSVAQAVTISMAIPGTNINNTTTTGIGGFVANFYQFALMIGGVLAFGVVVYGGVKYMTSAGNPSGQSDAKEWIQSALLGLALLVGAYFVLSVINPQLTTLSLPAIPAANVTPAAAGPALLNPGANCDPSSCLAPDSCATLPGGGSSCENTLGNDTQGSTTVCNPSFCSGSVDADGVPEANICEDVAGGGSVCMSPLGTSVDAIAHTCNAQLCAQTSGVCGPAANGQGQQCDINPIPSIE